MNDAYFSKILLSRFPFAPTTKQEIFFRMVSSFIMDPSNESIFVLKGYAGTGKTTVVSTLVNNLLEVKRKYVLLAPTGRAAKVISSYSGKPAYTIHKKIYFPKKLSGGGMGFTMAQNKHRDTVFFVDEASMISDANSEASYYENGSLLDDLIYYVYSGHNCKLILLGDTAQLPPVQLDVSPALDVDGLAQRYDMKVHSIEFDEVMRQEENSGILANATEIRNLLKGDFVPTLQFGLYGYRDIVRLTDGYEIEDAIHSAYGKYSIEDTAFIVRSNKRANQYNQQIRTRILGRESELAAGDYLMVVKNNYFWLKDSSHADFIANGDIIEVLGIYRYQELYGFRFAQAKVRMIDYPDQPPFDTVLLLDTLTSESPSLTYAESNRLYEEVMKDYEDERTKYRRLQKVKENEYFNALQVKFSYAMTCHKSQGGQWNTVFIEQPYLPDGISTDYIRWLYTAVTRAKEKLYLIGFGDEWFES